MNSSFAQHLLLWSPKLALALRAVLGFLILFDIFRGNTYTALFYGGIWLVIFGLSWLGKSHEYYSVVDAVMLFFFILAWNAPSLGMQMESSVLGIDKVFHTTGGALLGVVGLLIAARWVPDARARAVVAVLAALGIGAAWEVFEWLFHFMQPMFMQTTYMDSMLDIIADTLGGILVAGAWYIWHRRSSRAYR